MNSLLIIVGTAALGYALRTFAHPLPRKLGALSYLVASYVAGLSLTGVHAGGVAAVASWFLLPWVEIVLRVRRLRLPLEKSLRHRFPPSRQDFPQLTELTGELESEGFEQTDDAGFDWQEMRQFLRVCYHAPSKTQAIIHLNQQSNLSVVFVSITSRALDGRIITSSNYPFSWTMQAPPNLVLHRVPGADSFAALLAEHRAMLAERSIGENDLTTPGAEGLAEQLQADLDQQVTHNLLRGLIVKAGEGTFRYSWRGCFYLWAQLVKDMVRFA
ncbi:MAG: hypothetical protein EOP86_09690 [Verrucomicrobiaceae bacterium]|nr:MAG: hypothetical protein EOP86_09690 [Verrucomicrobiaceae bacterium]